MLDADHIAEHSQHDSQDCIFVLSLNDFFLEENVADMADWHVVRLGWLREVQISTMTARVVMVSFIDKDVKTNKVRVFIEWLIALYEFKL